MNPKSLLRGRSKISVSRPKMGKILGGKGGTPLLECGDLAPDFDLPVLLGGVKRRFHLREQREKKNIVLAFYPSNWESVSAEQMIAYQVEREKFVAQNAEVVGITVDSIMNITAWEREIGPFDYFLCSDFWPHGQVCEQYGVLRQSEPFRGASDRAVFVIDQIGKVRYKRIYPVDEKPDLKEVLAALQNL
jgi:peroxiredoxin